MEILGIGTHITECLRIARMIERHGEQFIDRVYTPEEVRYCHNRKQATQHFAAYWAAKEAVLKALGTRWVRGIDWRDIEIRPGPGGRTTVALSGGVQQWAQKKAVLQIQVSISHCRAYATALALALGQPAKPPDT